MCTIIQAAITTGHLSITTIVSVIFVHRRVKLLFILVPYPVHLVYLRHVYVTSTAHGNSTPNCTTDAAYLGNSNGFPRIGFESTETDVVESLSALED